MNAAFASLRQGALPGSGRSKPALL